MIDFYYNAGPNPMKVALFLEESGLPYRLVPVDMLRGEQFSPEIVRLNPNSKLPIIVDDGVTVFDSNAILLYLAEKYQLFLPAAEHRGQLLSWLMFAATGLGPYSGQAVHFRHYAPAPKDYAQQRYSFEARRHYDVLEAHLAQRQWMVGDAYSIVDMAVWGWIRNMDHVLGPEARADLPNVVRLVQEIEAHPAAQAAVGLREKHSFKAEFDDEARRAMFRHLEPAK
ncbi:glutathione S-transferase family protein [Sphingomonas sp. SRS2]|uniref:glutathione S-transferase family protein n=1 Tax=Sphingomonas sp. SRS2 TaxID=133190 RepID=UPI0006184415|nr:glutathione S-transferase N-terminal domain-containing protein [Sphingomonas sp. SRS2]KKC27006.1 glutathione S-transferase [Sphingomonas sp. SRS2]